MVTDDFFEDDDWDWDDDFGEGSLEPEIEVPKMGDDNDALMSNFLQGLSDALDPKKAAANARWKPQEGPQEMAFYSDADEVLYGGAAGGGKTDLMLGLALSDLSPHKRAIVFRTSYPEFKDLIKRAQQILENTPAKFKAGNAMRFDNLPDGKSLELGSVANFAMAQRYRGRAHDLKMFDELTNIPEIVYTFLIGWARTTTPGLRVRVVSATNPPTDSEGTWVIRRWRPWLDPTHPNPAKDGELRWFSTLDGEDVEITEEVSLEGSQGIPFRRINQRGKDELIRPKSRTFIPARLENNKYIDPDYEAALGNMPEPYRSQLLYGEFGASMKADPFQVIPTRHLAISQAKYKALAAEGGLKKYDQVAPAFGIDVAEAGADKTTLAKVTAHILQYFQYIEVPGDDQMLQADAVELLMAKTKRAPIAVDAIGVGIGLASRLAQKRFRVMPVKVQRKSERTDKTKQFHFANLRAELWWRLREALDPDNEEQFLIPDDPRITSELLSAKFWRDSQDRIHIEPKKDIKARLMRSPDIAEAIMLALYAQQTNGREFRMV